MHARQSLHVKKLRRDHKSYFTHNSTSWLKLWKVSNEDWIKLKRVIRFIISLSEKPILSAGAFLYAKVFKFFDGLFFSVRGCNSPNY